MEEDKETLSRHATQEILQVISQSRHDEGPVFDAILKNAQLLCNAPLAFLSLVNEARTHVLIPAQRGARPDFAEVLKGFVEPIERSELLAVRPVVEPQVIMMDDIADHELYRKRDPRRVQMVEVEGVRSVLVVPLIKDEQGIGAITLYRREVSPFSEGDVALIQNFAAQAVIAIENVRQFRELKTRLERESATAEILKILSQSHDDEKPIFDAILQSAAKLCEAQSGFLFTVNQERTHYGAVAHIGALKNFLETDAVLHSPLDNELVVSRAINNRVVQQIEDLKNDDVYTKGNPIRVQTVDQGGVRTMLAVPLVHNNLGIGAICLYRRDVSPFSEDQISLVESFASQAVIAINKVRQFRELQTRLEREEATADILKVISRSRDNEIPVYDAILKHASRLCHAPMAVFGVITVDRKHFRIAAHTGTNPEFIDTLNASPPELDPERYAAARAMVEMRTIEIEDLADPKLYGAEDEARVQSVTMEGIRSAFCVPLTLNEQSIGGIFLYRREVSPFNQDEIALVETFAAQAVIAIENVRQFREVRERLEREAATKEVLQIISENRDDEIPVFEAILERACRLCEAPSAGLLLGNPEDKYVTFAASAGTNPKVSSALRSANNPMDADASYSARAIIKGKLYHLEDMGESDLYKNGADFVRNNVDKLGIRSVIFAPLMGQKGAMGVIALFREEVRPFDSNQVELVESFAAQAAIAIENVRQFKALETLNTELGDRVDEQVGEIERMGKLKRFLPAAVADTVVSRGSEKMLSSHRALLGVLFCDIRGFTAFCETAEPEETIEVLQTYHQEMGKLINEHGAGVDHRMGDGIMVLFNDPIACEDPAGDAVRLAIAMRAGMAELAKKWKRLGHRLGFGVGISLGYATVGMVGYEDRYDYTASGTAVNLAARLCDHAKDEEILLSARARTAVEDDFDTASAGEFSLKGMREPVEVFRLQTSVP